jgi:hypothetical protein
MTVEEYHETVVQPAKRAALGACAELLICLREHVMAQPLADPVNAIIARNIRQLVACKADMHLVSSEGGAPALPPGAWSDLDHAAICACRNYENVLTRYKVLLGIDESPLDMLPNSR